MKIVLIFCIATSKVFIFLTLLEKHHVSKEALKYIIDSTETFVEIYNQMHIANIKTELIDIGIPREIVNSVQSLTQDNPVHISENLRTDYMHEKYYMSHFNYVPPVEHRTYGYLNVLPGQKSNY